MFHVKFVFVGEMIVGASFTKHRVDSIVISNENIAELLLALEILDLLHFNFLAELVNEPIE